MLHLFFSWRLCSGGLGHGLCCRLSDRLSDRLGGGLGDRLGDGLGDGLGAGLGDGLGDGLSDGLSSGLGFIRHDLFSTEIHIGSQAYFAFFPYIASYSTVFC